MTLIVSEVSKFGIAMAADSAITEIYPKDFILPSGKQVPPTVRVGAQKLIPINAINAAISVWGFGTVGTPTDKKAMIPIDKFLLDFADSIDNTLSLDDVGNKLVDLINPKIKIGEVRGGFHLSGYIQQNGKYFPALYHIHTGGKSEKPSELQLHKDYPFEICNVEEWLDKLDRGVIYHIRNGSYETYAFFSKYLSELMTRLQKETNFICPDPQRFPSPIEARGRYLKLQIQTICEFYRLSNCLETIAMPISWLTISQKGIECFEPVVI